MTNFLWTLLAGLLLLEIVEHFIFPLVWLIASRNRPSPAGPSGMVGRTVTVHSWDRKRGKVRYHGELWDAECAVPLSVGRPAVIDRVDGLTLKVTPL